jgi:hypothetical protein
MKWSSITHPSSGWLAIICLVGLVLPFGIYIAYGHLTEHTASVPDAQPQVLDETSGACSVDRLHLACERATDHDYPGCYVTPGLGTVVEMRTITAHPGDVWARHHGSIARRADGRLALVLDPEHASCRDDDHKLEHELICHLYGVGHTGLTGSLCAATPGQMGTIIPRRVP